jgi:hypothetical protein
MLSITVFSPQRPQPVAFDATTATGTGKRGNISEHTSLPSGSLSMPSLWRNVLYDAATALFDCHIFKSLHEPLHAPTTGTAGAGAHSSEVRPASPPACTMSDMKASSPLCSDASKSTFFGREGIRLLLGLILAVSVILFSFIVPITRHCLGHAPTARGTLSLATLVAWSCATLALMLGMPLYESAWRAFRHASSANVDTLVVVSAMLSYAYSCAIATTAMLDGSDARHAGDSYFETSAILIPLVLLGRFFESCTLQMTRTAMPVSSGSLSAFASTADSLNATGSGVDTGVQLLQSHQPNHVSQSQQAEVRAQRITPLRITERASAVYVSCVLTGAILVFVLRLALSVTGAVILPEGERSSILYSLRCAIVLLICSCPCAICLAAPTAIMVCMPVWLLTLQDHLATTAVRTNSKLFFFPFPLPTRSARLSALESASTFATVQRSNACNACLTLYSTPLCFPLWISHQSLTRCDPKPRRHDCMNRKLVPALVHGVPRVSFLFFNFGPVQVPLVLVCAGDRVVDSDCRRSRVARSGRQRSCLSCAGRSTWCAVMQCSRRHKAMRPCSRAPVAPADGHGPECARRKCQPCNGGICRRLGKRICRHPRNRRHWHAHGRKSQSSGAFSLVAECMSIVCKVYLLVSVHRCRVVPFSCLPRRLRLPPTMCPRVHRCRL